MACLLFPFICITATFVFVSPLPTSRFGLPALAPGDCPAHSFDLSLVAQVSYLNGGTFIGHCNSYRILQSLL